MSVSKMGVVLHRACRVKASEQY